jgi:type IX secretion system PorP/SprF family membrane protein
MNIKKISFLLFGAIVSFNSFAVDPHFSQFYATPLNLNPALTGLNYGKIRASGIYRSQWGSLIPFNTYGFSLDMAAGKKSENKNFGGIGLNITNDGAGTNSLNSFNGFLSLAFHKTLGSKGNSYLALGFQGGLAQKSITTASLSAQNQWVAGQGSDATVTNGETFSGASISYPDFNAGLFWYNYLGEKNSVFLGFSSFHLTQPTATFLGGTEKLTRRYLVHGGSRFAVAKKINLLPNAIYMMQNGLSELNIGTSMEFDFSQSPKFRAVSIGGWYRNTDAIIASIAFELVNFNIGLSYDLSTSDIKSATSGNGGFEISLTYTFVPKSMLSNNIKLSSNPYPTL